MKELTRFNYEGTELRTVLIDGEPWFVLGDLCKALGFARGASQVADRLRKGVRRSYPLPTAGGRQAYTRPDDTAGTTYTTRVQPSGLGFIARKLGLEHLLELDAVTA